MYIVTETSYTTLVYAVICFYAVAENKFENKIIQIYMNKMRYSVQK